MLKNGTVAFTMPVEGISGTTDNSLVTYSQLQEISNRNNDHETLRNCDKDDAHPQYLLKSGDAMTGKLSIRTPVDDDEPVPYYMYKRINDVIENCYWKVNNS